MSSNDNIFGSIRSVLLRDWDPLEIVPQGIVDEYERYVPILTCMLRCGSPATEIAEYLLLVERQYMSIKDPDIARAQIVADRLLNILENDLPA